MGGHNRHTLRGAYPSNMNPRHVFRLLAATGIAAFAACAAPDITGIDRQQAEQDASLFSFGGGPKLVECPTGESFSNSGTIGAAGGLLSAGGVTIAIPANALLTEAVVSITVPASKYVEADITVQGSEHFEFELPVVVTMSYARCSRSNIDLMPLSAWYIDSDSKQLLEKQPSVDNKLLRTVTFTTGHLSGYAIAN